MLGLVWSERMVGNHVPAKNNGDAKTRLSGLSISWGRAVA
jgi:hypothetical protein